VKPFPTLKWMSLFARSAVLLLFVGCCFAQSQSSGLDLQAIDKSVDPCESLYRYACGNYVKTHPIPPDESSWGRFNELHDRNLDILRGILEDSSRNQQRSAVDQKIGGFYQSCMNEAAIEQRGTSPLEPELQRIGQIASLADLIDEVARLQQQQVSVFFNFGASPDPKDARMEIAAVDQGGLGLPERDFYFRTDPKSTEVRQKYVQHIAKMFELTGISAPDAEKKAAIVMGIETDLAKASLDVTSLRDPQKTLHEMSVDQLSSMSPEFRFAEFFRQVQTPPFSKLNVGEPDFIKALNTVLATHSMDEIRDYLRWHYVSSSAKLLPHRFVDENFAFYGRELSGTTQLRPRWKRCVAAVDDELGDALGQKYVEKTFGEEGKARTLQIVHEIEHQMSLDIQSISWMSPETKTQAEVKLKAVADKIGYPDKWRDYSTVTIADDDYFGNWYRANEFESRRDRNKIGKPVDRSEWGMTPPTVNAYYDPTQNNINFPAGILQPPFFSNTASDAVNYGAIGAVVGHELTHGFDDEGRQFDADGNLRDWWTAEDEKRFKEKADCLVKEYSGFSPVPGLHINGELTLGENTADNGGVRLAYMALLDDLAKKGTPLTQKTGEYTEAQQFFLGYAQDWCENMRPEEVRLLTQTDPHSPPEFRVDGVASNMPQFAAAFGCKPTSKMVSANACRVW
jgi:putative endopeptidase